MKNKNLISVIIAIILVSGYFLWNNGTLNLNKTRIYDDGYLVNEDESYSVYCTQPKSGLGLRNKSFQELIANSIDSIIVSSKYGTLLHGIDPADRKGKWFYIDVSPVKNIHKDFSNLNEAISLTIGKKYLDSVMTVEETLKKYN
jgi:hypothetical protein